MKHRWLLYLSIALALLCSLPPGARAMVQIGQVAPDFTLVDPDGVSFTLSAYRGQVVVLCFIGYG